MMVTYGKDNVRGGRWLKEGTKHLPELYDARNIMDLHRKDKATIRDELMILALKSGLKYSWYWRDFLEKYPSIKEGRFFVNLLSKCSI